MIGFNNYLDKLSLIKVLSFFLAIMLVLTLIPMLFNFYLGTLLSKFILYAVMLAYFVYEFKGIELAKEDGDSFWAVLKKEYGSLFKTTDFYHVSFIVIANILFVSAVYFVLKYLSTMSLLSFDSPLFGDFSAFGIDILVLYLLTVVILSPIIEEILFRGLFLRRFNKGLDNLTLAILTSSILFGLCHNFGGISGAILFGICASILYIKSRNILVPILAHFLNNLISFILALSGIEHLIQGNSLAIIPIVILAILTNFILFKAIIDEWPNVMD